MAGATTITGLAQDIRIKVPLLSTARSKRESQLQAVYWDGSTWATDGTRVCGKGSTSVTLCTNHLTDFGIITNNATNGSSPTPAPAPSPAPTPTPTPAKTQTVTVVISMQGVTVAQFNNANV